MKRENLKIGPMTQGSVAAGHEKTAQAALEILEEGGNAFDAAVGAGFAACAAEPVLTSLGGGGFFLARPRPRGNCFFSFSSQPPAVFPHHRIWISIPSTPTSAPPPRSFTSG